MNDAERKRGGGWVKGLYSPYGRCLNQFNSRSKQRKSEQTSLNQLLALQAMDTLNIKPLSEDREWSPEAPVGVEATRDMGPAHAPTDVASTSSEERAVRRITGRWGAEWLS